MDPFYNGSQVGMWKHVPVLSFSKALAVEEKIYINILPIINPSIGRCLDSLIPIGYYKPQLILLVGIILLKYSRE